MAEVREGSVVSVGDALQTSSMYSRSHPVYNKVITEITKKVSESSQKESVRRSNAFPVLNTVNLSLVESDLLAKQYPEFTIYNYTNSSPGHAYFVAARQLANDYLTYMAIKYTDSIIHVGGSALSYMLREELDVHIEMDTTDAVAVHSQLTESINTARIFSDYSTVIADTGAMCCRRNYELYRAREKYVSCTTGFSCRKQAEVVCVDLSLYPMAPIQFAASMRQAGASVGFGFIPYDPLILLSDEGYLADTGIKFLKTAHAIEFVYPEGQQGVKFVPMAVYTAWLTEHEVVIGAGSSARVYHCQLGKRRGPFLFFQLTVVDVKPGSCLFKHALDLPQQDENYVVTAYVLKDLVSDPALAASWTKTVFMFSVKIVDKLYEFSMQLSPEAFSRYAIAKQLKVMDRVTLAGTTISHSTVPQQDIAIVCIVHARAFVDRYESGQLTKEMMSHLKMVAAFGSASRLQKLKAVTAWAMYYAWDVTLGSFASTISSLCDWLHKCLSPTLEQPQFALAPSYVLYSSLVKTWRDRFSFKQQAASTLLSTQYTCCSSKVRGDALAYAIHKVVDVPVSANRIALASASLGVVSSEVSHVYEDTTTTSLTEDLETDIAAEIADALITDLRMLNDFDEPSVDRHVMPTTKPVLSDSQTNSMKPDFEYDPDYLDTLNRVYEEFNPGVAELPIYRDIASLSYDDQDRHLVAEYLRIPRVMDMVPKDRDYYLSKVLAINAPKRQETQHELLSSLADRNLSAPRISLPQDSKTIIPDIWDKFLSTMCVSNAKEKLASYQADPVALEETAYRDWISKAKPDAVKAVRKEIEDESKSLSEMSVSDYLMMLKSDVKPPLGDKPLHKRIEPQVIMYHRKALSSMYSSIFRVLIRRFLSLLKHNIHLNLLKDNEYIGKFITELHPFDKKLTYLENDFSKYDKSQDEFVYELESHILQQLGMNLDMLARWVEGHVEASIRSITTGISLSVRYQRKSGDGFTAGGNGFLNIVSVAYAYSPSDIAWAVFMGDDSIVCLRSAGYSEDAVQILAEVFNLSAKMYVTDSPYFASTFIVVDDDNRHISMVPDPIKWIEKRSQPISAEDPQWRERYISAADSCSVYKYRINTSQIARMVSERYSISKKSAGALPSAIATAISTFDNFRGCYFSEVTKLNY